MVSVLPVAGRRVLVSSLAAVASLVPLTAVPALAAGAAPPPVRPEDQAPRTARHGGDHLTVVVRHAGTGRDGTYDVSCHPGAGRHPDVAGACQVLDTHTRWGRDPFAPVDPGSACTMVYGGPATAHVTGTWAGHPVDASYDRSNGCEIGRWDRMVPLLPRLGATPSA
ncbi:Subtilisin inhibitor-like [Streptomyces sp. 1222.5]|uniref:SSI family serine proteinase inhibitor n=1 Tax=unclassified Streptomyces TaxID=2593676 RepID=UPI000895BC2E|nr:MULTISPECIES: SSI family serine proteinase inhibitor [unclassified Streptomyces]PKW08733.1 subtilisin inhibitor-like [Streptomyces sp. 5112.2]SEC55023.1 Subtilisin inhibitor-like [Streptomyces sp. 1222.5]